MSGKGLKKSELRQTVCRNGGIKIVNENIKIKHLLYILLNLMFYKLKSINNKCHKDFKCKSD